MVKWIQPIEEQDDTGDMTTFDYFVAAICITIFIIVDTPVVRTLITVCCKAFINSNKEVSISLSCLL